MGNVFSSKSSSLGRPAIPPSATNAISWPPTSAASTTSPSASSSTTSPPVSFPSSTTSPPVSFPSSTTRPSVYSPSYPSVQATRVVSSAYVPQVATGQALFPANEYKVPNSLNEFSENDLCLPYPMPNKTENWELRVCCHFNSQKGCHFPFCLRFHMCLDNILGKCEGGSCKLPHEITLPFNSPKLVMLYRKKPKFFESLKKNYEFTKQRKGRGNNICLAFLRRQCKFAKCNFVHSRQAYCWQVQNHDTWADIPNCITVTMEKGYCQPNCEAISLPPFNGMKREKSFSTFWSAVSSDKWTFHPRSMELSCKSKCIAVRRLSTPSDVVTNSSFGTRWIWYWEDGLHCWNVYKTGIREGFFILSLSDFLESQFHKNITSFKITIGSHVYNFDLVAMTQTNESTGMVRNVMRRPVLTLDLDPNTEMSLRSLWVTDFYQITLRYCVPFGSDEYFFIRGMLSRTMILSGSVFIERVENHFLWNSYQNKKDEMLCSYGNNLNLLDEQYLFHGTSADVVDAICRKSFDWRLYGTNVGNIFGRGTYFANSADISDRYTKPENGVKIMFVALVLVGYATKGDASMDIPPKNTLTGKLFDSTVDSNTNPCIFVKYNLDEYYPSYVVYYTC